VHLEDYPQVQNASGGDPLVRMPRVIIFDLDGTIIKLTLPLEAMRSETKLFYTIKGYPADMFDPADGISSSTEKAMGPLLSSGMKWNGKSIFSMKRMSYHLLRMWC
jgi:hypothetical protein